jgi:hypothetical protein
MTANRILVVEDDDDLRSLPIRGLVEEGFGSAPSRPAPRHASRPARRSTCSWSTSASCGRATGAYRP